MAAQAALQQLQRRLADRGVYVPAERPAAPARRWGLAALAGRLSELSATGGAALTPALGLVAEAQAGGEPAAWVALRDRGTFYPPDAAAHGIDLAALAVVRVPDAPVAARAADRLARSGAFGLVVLDLGPAARVPAALQGRLVQQAQRQHMAVLCLTEKTPGSASLGSLVGLRGQAERRRAGAGQYVCTVRVLKDKRHGPGWVHEETYHGAPGLR